MTRRDERVIDSVEQLSGEYFDRVLAASGALTSGGVAGFDVQVQGSNWSTIGRIALRYTPGSTGLLPTKLFLKMCDSAELGPSEMEFYARDYIDLADAPLPNCYDAVYSAPRRRYHLLLEDLSETHQNYDHVALTEASGGAVAEAMARLHAHWWGEERLRSGGHPLLGPREIDRYVEHARDGLAPLLQAVGAELEPADREALIGLFEQHPPLMRERAREGATLTLVHGDPNPSNLLSPLRGTHPVYLIDRQPFDWSLTTWLGVSDLAYMMVHWWETEIRRRLEVPVLRRYHATLVERGVSGYSWEQLWRDYRLTAVQSLYVPAEWRRIEEERTRVGWLWRLQLKKALAAFHDLRCRELWGA